MGDFLLVSHPSADAVAATLTRDLAQEARAKGMTVLGLNPHTWLAVVGPHAPSVTTVGAWTLIGDVLNRRSPVLPTSPAGDPWDFERKLFARFWGRFAGIRFGTKDQPVALLRDPSGAVECVAWEQADLTFVASFIPPWLVERLRPKWRINVGRLAAALRDPIAGTGSLMLDGPVALEPGTVQPLPLDSAPAVLWRPADFARRSLGRYPSIDEAAERLRAALDEAVNGLAGLSGPLAAEISGGLDSALVATSLARRSDPVKVWINAYGAVPEADERPYVMALAQKLGVEPLCVPHATGPMTSAWLEQASQGFRPGFSALDRPHDMDWARRLGEAGVTAVMTGKGGDSILLQRATADVFADLWADRGWMSLLAPDVAELTAANEISLWTMVSHARRHQRFDHRWPTRSHPLIPQLEIEPSPHPWLLGCEDFGPAKAFQIVGVADSVSRHGPSMLTEAIDVRHPLCAQPVIEACLALPTPVLIHGGRDRGLARQAFRDRLPTEIAQRRSKGDMTRIYGHMILDSLDVLRPWLIDGRLAALGVIDPEAADRGLRREALVWKGSYSTFIVAAAFEGWVRAWERRLGPAA